MSLSKRVLIALFRGLTSSIFRIHDEELARVPVNGPLIIVMNHVNILEIPLIYSHLQPRKVRGLVLADRWKNPILGWGLDACDSIPIHRESGNAQAMRTALDALKAGEVLLIMPEGTRSRHGRLQPGNPGVVLLALKSRAPLLPIVSYGSEGYQNNLKKLRRTDFYIRVGEPFVVRSAVTISDSQSRKIILQEIMHRLAALLPQEYRGVYTNDSALVQTYLETIRL